MTRMSSSKGYKEEGEGGKEEGREEEGVLRRWLTGQVGPTTAKGGSQGQLISSNTEEGRNEGGTLSRGLIDQVGPTASDRNATRGGCQEQDGKDRGDNGSNLSNRLELKELIEGGLIECTLETGGAELRADRSISRGLRVVVEAQLVNLSSTRTGPPVGSGKQIGADHRLAKIQHSCCPNVRLDVEGEEVVFRTLHTIGKGEAITADFTRAGERWLGEECHCGSRACTGSGTGEDAQGTSRSVRRRRQAMMPAPKGEHAVILSLTDRARSTPQHRARHEGLARRRNPRPARAWRQGWQEPPDQRLSPPRPSLPPHPRWPPRKPEGRQKNRHDQARHRPRLRRQGLPHRPPHR